MALSHPRITGIVVDPEDYQPFFFVGPDYSMFVRRQIRPPLRLDSDNERLGLHTGSRPQFVNEIDQHEVEREVRRVLKACGSSRARGKAALAAFILFNSFSARWVPIPFSAIRALEQVLRPGKKWRAAPEDWLAGLEEAETFALQIVAYVRSCGSDLHARRAALDLMCWHAASDWPIPSVVAVNALGVVLGVMDNTAHAQPAARQLALRVRSVTSDGDNAIVEAAKRDGVNRAITGLRQTAKEHLKIIDPAHYESDELARAFNKAREKEAYFEIEADSLRDAEAPVRNFKVLAQIGRWAWRRFNRGPRKRRRGVFQKGHF